MVMKITRKASKMVSQTSNLLSRLMEYKFLKPLRVLQADNQVPVAVVENEVSVQSD